MTKTVDSLTHLITQRAKEYPETPAIYTSVSKSDSTNKKLLRVLTYGQINRAVDRLAWYFSDALGLSPDKIKQHQDPPVIAVLVSSTIYESLLECALAKVGACALLLSTNNSVPAIADMCKKTKALALIWGASYEMQAKETAGLLNKDGVDMPLFEENRIELWGKHGVEDVGSVEEFKPRFDPPAERRRTAAIMHSSGSTGFPKPVPVTHTWAIETLRSDPKKPTFSTAPVFHGYGHFAVFGCISSVQPLVLFPSYLPLTVPNIIRVLDEANIIPGAKPEQMWTVPYVIKLMAETKKGLAALASFSLVSSGGAPFPDDFGERLVNEYGINLSSVYGTVEAGVTLTSWRDYKNDKTWNYLRPVPAVVPFSEFEDQGDGTYEFVVKDGFPPLSYSNREDKSYASHDLFKRHPERPNLYKYIGRLDDTIVQFLGEKTNPVPIESSIRSSPFVSEAIVFGTGRPSIGVLILPTLLARGQGLVPSSGADNTLIPTNQATQFIDCIWPVIEKANSEAPSHSRLTREMVGVLHCEAQVLFASKMTVQRAACYSKFGTLIDSIYEPASSFGTDEQVLLDIPAPPEAPTALEDHLLSLVQIALPDSKKPSKADDLFELGVDSLQSAKIRNELQKLISPRTKSVKLGQNVVYEYPTVVKLAQHMVEVVHNRTNRVKDDDEKLMMRWVNEYSAGLVRAVPLKERDGHHVVLLTGATGSLGAHILFSLIGLRKVDKVVCLSRAKSHADSATRVKASLKLRKLELSDKEFDKVICFAGDINAEDGRFGLTDGELDELDVSVVIHNAWPVNFSYSLATYRPHIRGAVNLLNLARSRGASFFFSSSIATRMESPSSTCVEEFSANDDTSSVLNQGYARSKWIIEKVCEKAGGGAGVFRIGQMVGDTKDGIWNVTESWPLMFKCANTIGAIPLTHEKISFLPVDIAGAAISQIALNSVYRPTLYHILSPHETNWDDIIIRGLREGGLNFDTVSVKEWLSRLQASDGDMERNPARKLLPYYERRLQYGKSGPLYSTERACRISSALAGATPITTDMVRKWVEHWKEVHFL